MSAPSIEDTWEGPGRQAAGVVYEKCKPHTGIFKKKRKVRLKSII